MDFEDQIVNYESEMEKALTVIYKNLKEIQVKRDKLTDSTDLKTTKSPFVENNCCQEPLKKSQIKHCQPCEIDWDMKNCYSKFSTNFVNDMSLVDQTESETNQSMRTIKDTVENAPTLATAVKRRKLPEAPVERSVVVRSKNLLSL